MPFNLHVFLEHALRCVDVADGEELIRLCGDCESMRTPRQKAGSIRLMMDVLERSLDERSRRSVMEACGRRCIGASILKKARRIGQSAIGLDDLIARLNKAKVGGGDLRREGDTILVNYGRCYCGSVSKTTERFSPTYCYCSCGYCRQLFEAILQRPVEVELVSSVIQGDKSCVFKVTM